MYRSKNAVLHSVSVLAEQASLALSNVAGLALRGTMRSMVDSLRLRRGFLTCAAGEIDKPRCVSYFSTTPKVCETLCSFFMDKNLPIADISAQAPFFGYDTDTAKQTTRAFSENQPQRWVQESFRECSHKQEVTLMRHVYIRGIMGLIWLAAAIVSGMSGNFEMGTLYTILGGIFLYSAYTMWKKDKKGE